MRILLIDDHVSFCEGVRAAMQAVGAPHVLDYEADAEWLPGAVMGRVDYDLLLVDLMMPGMGGMDLLRHLVASRDPVPVIVLSSVEDEAMIREALALGAVGYVPKSSSIEDILDAIEQCRRGLLYVPERLLSGHRAAAPSRETVGHDAGPLELTRRQLEIISLMERGLSNQAIADQLFISKATVKTHVHQIFRAFGVHNRISCLRMARQRGLTGIPSASASRDVCSQDITLDQGT
ncbi:MAG: response regulator transcription factor [Pseudohongiellaceae bacterium]